MRQSARLKAIFDSRHLSTLKSKGEGSVPLAGPPLVASTARCRATSVASRSVCSGSFQTWKEPTGIYHFVFREVGISFDGCSLGRRSRSTAGLSVRLLLLKETTMVESFLRRLLLLLLQVLRTVLSFSRRDEALNSLLPAERRLKGAVRHGVASRLISRDGSGLVKRRTQRPTAEQSSQQRPRSDKI